MNIDLIEEFLELPIIGDNDADQDNIDKLIALVRVYREADLPPCARGCVRCDVALVAEERALEIVNEKV